MALSRTLLLVDMKNQAYRACSTHRALSSGRVFTGGLYGVLASLCRAVVREGATSVAFATDTSPYVRREEFDGYKSDRDKKKEVDETLVMQVASSIRLIKEMLEVLRVPFWELKGYEYDDIAAWAADQYGPRYDRVVAMTNDSDLYQVFFSHDNFGIYTSSKEKLFTMREFRLEYPEVTSARLWVKMRAITGTHNAVPGVYGVADKTALKHMRDPAKWRAFMKQHIEFLERNEPLIVLPHARFPKDPGLRLCRHDFKVGDAVRWLERYDITVTGQMLQALTQLRGD